MGALQCSVDKEMIGEGEASREHAAGSLQGVRWRRVRGHQPVDHGRDASAELTKRAVILVIGALAEHLPPAGIFVFSAETVRDIGLDALEILERTPARAKMALYWPDGAHLRSPGGGLLACKLYFLGPRGALGALREPRLAIAPEVTFVFGTDVLEVCEAAALLINNVPLM